MRIILLLCAAWTMGHAEERTVIMGRVLDPSGAVVPSAVIQLRETSSGETTLDITGERGRYWIRLRPGVYELAVEALGFERYERGTLAIEAGQTAVVNVSLEIAPLAQRMTVAAKAPPLEGELETRTRNFQEVLEIREVRESSARDVAEAVSRIEGIWKIRKGGIASDLVLRGFQQDNINVLIDGQRIYGACPSNMDPPAFHVDFAEVKHVEVVKGAFDIANQGSLGGAIHIVSKEPTRGLRLTPNLSAGSFGYANPSVTASASNEKFYGLGAYSFRRSEPYRDGAGVRFTEYANYRPDARGRDAFDVKTGWFKFGAALSDKQRLDVSYTRQGAGEVLYPYLQMDALYDNADRAGASYVAGDLHGVLTRLRIQSYFTQVRHWMTDEHRISAAGAPLPYSMATFAGTKALGGHVEAEFSNLVTGFETYRRNWNNVTVMRMSGYAGQPSVPDVNTTSAGFYGSYRRVLADRLLLTAGARLDHARSEARSAALSTDLFWAYKATRSTAASDTNPSGNVWLAHTLPKGFELFAGFGHTVRVPDPQERYMALRRMGTDWVGNPLLRPTKNTEADAGVSFRSARFKLRPTLFYSRLADFIVVHNQPRLNPLPMMMNSTARSAENVDARLYGGEVTWSAGITSALLVSGGLSYARGTKELKPAARIFDRDLAELPPLKSRAAVRYGTRLFFGEVEGIAVRAQSRTDSDLQERATPGYAVLNLKGGTHSRKLNLAIGVDNVFDRFYYEHLSYQRDPFRLANKVPEPGRSVYVNISYGF